MSTPADLAPGLRVICAPNPSPMTHTGTNTYLVGHGQVAVIDPGPDDPSHLAAILAAKGQGISHILVTHAHLDHSPLARQLSNRTGAPVLAYGNARAGRSDAMTGLTDVGGGEGVDHEFAPDICLPDGALISGDGWTMQAIWTPGHFGNHLSFAWNDVLFTGDLVMGWASSLVSPPDGDLTQFMRSCARLSGQPWTRFYPGHGAPVDDPAARLDWLIAHRRSRERDILIELRLGAADPATLARRIYVDVAPALLPAATRNVLAHLIDLQERNLITWDGEPGPGTVARMS